MKLSIIALLAATAISQVFAASDHFYTTSPTGETAAAAGYHFEEVAAYVPTAGTTDAVPVYRYFNSVSGAHFWTSNPAEVPPAPYQSEGIGYYVFDVNAVAPSGTVPWYRWFSPSNGDHFYSTTYTEGESAGFNFEGVIGFVFPAASGTSVPLYRWYSGAA